MMKTGFFAIMKQACARGLVQKYWLTGVLPAFRDAISPLIESKVISTLPEYNGLCGLTDAEVRTIAKTYLVILPTWMENFRRSSGGPTAIGSLPDAMKPIHCIT